MNDTRVRRDDFEVAERGLTPAQERVALAVALELDLGVLRQSIGSTVMIDLHRVINDELSGCQRIHFLRVAAKLADRFAHRGEIDHAGDAGEVLHDHARRREGNLVIGGGLRLPVEQRVDVLARDINAVFKPQQVLEQNFERVGQSCHFLLRQRGEAPHLVGTRAYLQCFARAVTVGHRKPPETGELGKKRIEIIAIRSPRRPDSACLDTERRTGPGLPPAAETRNATPCCHRPEARRGRVGQADGNAV